MVAGAEARPARRVHLVAMRSERTQRRITRAWLLAGLSVSGNTIEASTNVEGAWWRALRFALSTVVVVALAAAALSWLHDRREPLRDIRIGVTALAAGLAAPFLVARLGGGIELTLLPLLLVVLGAAWLAVRTRARPAP